MVLLQSVHCASNSLLGTAFNQRNSGCSSQHLLKIHFPVVVAESAAEDFPELAKCTVINNDRAVGKNATYVPGYFRKKYKTQS